MELDARFSRYTGFDPLVPVYRITADTPGCLHRFFDTSPVSPSGRYVAVTKLPSESRLPAPDDRAEVVVIDLVDGGISAPATSGCFDTQLGANVQWGASDRELYFNDIDWSTGRARPVAVRCDPQTGTRVELDGPVYMVSPDGRFSASPCLLRMPLTQPGYGAVTLPSHLPYNHGASSDDGIYLTENSTGKSSLFLSFREIVESVGPELSESFTRAGAELSKRDLYGFHVKWNPEGTRLLFVVRARSGDPAVPLLNFVVTVELATQKVSLAMPPDLWSRGGHHPQWHPDGEHVIMNLNYPGREMRFVRYRFDGSSLELIADPVHGGGHPTIHPDGRYLLTDEYEHGPLAYPDGTTPIRLVDIPKSEVREIIRIRTRPDYQARGRELRVDPHPAWDPPFRYVAFNACPTGKREVCIADLRGLL